MVPEDRLTESSLADCLNYLKMVAKFGKMVSQLFVVDNFVRYRSSLPDKGIEVFSHGPFSVVWEVFALEVVR